MVRNGNTVPDSPTPSLSPSQIRPPISVATSTFNHSIFTPFSSEGWVLYLLRFVERFLKINGNPFEKLKPFIWYLRVIHVKNNNLYLFTPMRITTNQMAYVHYTCTRVAYGYPFFLLKTVVLADCPKLNKRLDAGVFSGGSYSTMRLSQPTFFSLVFFPIANLLCKIALYT